MKITVELWLLSHLFLDATECQGVASQSGNARRERSILLVQNITTPEIARNRGYPAEIHHVTTEDGYVLEMHRIPFGIRSKSDQSEQGSRPVVFLMHCMMCSSSDWLMNYPDKALGFILADEGYDVWMMNARGNHYSRKHVTLSPEQRKFWLFSFHEIAVYDVPAGIDYALEVSKRKKLSYIGYSMGSAIFYALMSERPEYNEKVDAAAILGPAAYMTHSKGTLFKFSQFEKLIEKSSQPLGLYEVSPMGKGMNIFTSTVCSRTNSHLNGVCLAIYSSVMEIDTEFINRDFLPFILNHVPAGGSLRTLIHFWQIKNTDRFQLYSYGKAGNLKVYGTRNPPLYDLKKTIVPVGLFTGRGDIYVDKKDVNRLARELPNVPYRYEVPNPNFSHFDFLWANDPSEILYKYVLDFLKTYL